MLKCTLSKFTKKMTESTWNLPNKLIEEPSLKVYNSLSRSKVEFIPTNGRTVTWYNCGPTVYDSSHMGHARNYLTQDIIRRILRDYFSYDVKFVMNITDVDDKIILKARHSHLLEKYKQDNPTPNEKVENDLLLSFQAFVEKVIPLFNNIPSIDALEHKQAAELIVSHAQNNLQAWSEKDPKAGMYVQTLRDGLEALSSQSIDKAQDILCPYLDKQFGESVRDPAIFRSLAAYWEGEFFKDMSALNVEKPDTLTRVSEYVPEIITFVEKIISNGFAYSSSDGSVYFDTKAFDGAKSKNGFEHSYAKLQPWSKGIKELIEEGEGSLSSGTGKKNSSDFALWKTSKPGEPSWTSPWGEGRPGWHIECSVMASEVLGHNIDIHSGGVDLKFPHHDNEIAQSEACHDCPEWINYFLHTGHLHIEGQKMSKSLKNFITIEEALRRFSARQLRLAFMLQLWNTPMDFKESAMTEVKNYESMLANFFTNVKAIKRDVNENVLEWDGKHHYDNLEKDLDGKLTNAKANVRAALCDSFNTPAALQVIADLVGNANVYVSQQRSANRVINVDILESIAKYTTKMLSIFGVIPANQLLEIGWSDSDNASGGDKEETIMPYVKVLSGFRDKVRQISIDKPENALTEILKLCDKIRDEECVDLGIALDDQTNGKNALVKLVNPDQLKAVKEEKEKQIALKAARSKLAKEQAEAKRIEKLKKGSVKPEEMFKNSTEFSQFDDQGIPTHDKDGQELAKKRRKNLIKEFESQTKLYKEYLDAGSPVF
ncbi:hypothetical protein WALSEDRAFT_34849 [Wallemia mellicola CBS 633.66]|uniref:cysteine--tRNA ligase n=1 Tax=Wallemia mellicola (strain ATCC MYA-4683 / CBS 633.66) TaxID=671144 RepID=I4YJS6_WALMC|nr:hypothetical protein WALSEDRAFT_34849 [Wallemia mellicola CBS 633.66]EIM24218.1 hypothetical protein WALSEDRAFT_34849 [Wallemia mellicola CBS 633.66]|eukprot:XP_006956036.1 hypothetical protein WALSEDRAFT_34849 [Wallemia mellicola CBS 633.66]